MLQKKTDEGGERDRAHETYVICPAHYAKRTETATYINKAGHIIIGKLLLRV